MNDIWNRNNISSNIETKGICNWKTSVQYLPETWGHISSCIINWVEIFHPQFADPKKPKWGMPYMFPNAWPLNDQQKEDSWLNLEQHGFGRVSIWKEVNEWVQELDFEPTVDFPHTGKVTNKIKITDDGSVIFHHSVSNLWDKEMPISTGLHPYFNIPKGDKSSVEWRMQWWDKISNDINLWSNDWTWSYDVPKDWKIVFFIPNIWEITLELSKEYSKFWVWSLNDKKGEKDFVCVEPVMNDEWWIADAPIMVAPWDTNHNTMKISLKNDVKNLASTKWFWIKADKILNIKA